MTKNTARPLLFILLGLMFLSTLPFWLFPLDIQISSIFYHPELGTGDAAWPVQNLPFVQFCYKAAPILTMLVALPALFIVLFGGLLSRIKPWRAHAAVVVLTVVLGPGLLVNGIFKEFWDRPRPVQTENFGGDFPYAPPLMIGEAAGGKSFPCGHCSAGFALAALWLLWRQRRPSLARAAGVLALLLGGAMGFSRIAAGGHYLSDVLWAAWLSFFSAWLSYYLIMRIPQREAGWTPAPLQLSTPLRWGIGGVVSVGVIFGALMASPVDLRWEHTFGANDWADGRVLRLERANPEVWLTAADTRSSVQIEAQWQGFGLPGGRVHASASDAGWVIAPQGVFSELRDAVKIQASLAAGETLHLQLDSKAHMTLHCVQGITMQRVQSNLPAAQVRWEGCDAP
ncbi:MAG: phosphatase PAP2 family protein [Halothiobacillaceae bacterium]|nr:phosphatase PAP2 family protein [Halothiobacillaceae bacterium]